MKYSQKLPTAVPDLNAMEKHFRKEISQAAAKESVFSHKVVVLMGMLAAPSMVIGTLFIPLIGLLLSLMLAFLTVIYLFLKREIALAFTWIAGAITSSVGCCLVTSFSLTAGEMMLYILIALATASLIAQVLFVSALIWSHYERGAEYLESLGTISKA
jgi:hypothetical protein